MAHEEITEATLDLIYKRAKLLPRLGLTAAETQELKELRLDLIYNFLTGTDTGPATLRLGTFYLDKADRLRDDYSKLKPRDACSQDSSKISSITGDIRREKIAARAQAAPPKQTAG